MYQYSKALLRNKVSKRIYPGMIQPDPNQSQLGHNPHGYNPA